jgi:DNA-binding NtrC family response regulator
MGQEESILVIDDVAEQRQIAAIMLNKLGYRATTAKSGEEALNLAAKSTFDVLLLDMIMEPGIDGLETYRQFLKIRPRQKAVIVSGYSETRRVQHALRLGATAYIKKPYSIEKIGLAISQAIRQGQSDASPATADESVSCKLCLPDPT